MTTADLLQLLKAEGVNVSLNVKLEASSKPSDEALRFVKRYRDDLVTLLALKHIGGIDYYLKIGTSSGKSYVMAKPHHIREAVGMYPWGVVSDSDGNFITSWGDVPESALAGLVALGSGTPVL